MTIKFLKQWGFRRSAEHRQELQRLLDGGCKISRDSGTVVLTHIRPDRSSYVADEWNFESSGQAVKFAAALNKLRRPIHIIKNELDADWARQVKERDNYTCMICGVQGDKQKTPTDKKSVDRLTAHHWFKTKSRAGMARWARECGATVHFAEHIHTLHENPCWVDLDKICGKVVWAETVPLELLREHLTTLVNTQATEDRVRALWLKRGIQPIERKKLKAVTKSLDSENDPEDIF